LTSIVAPLIAADVGDFRQGTREGAYGV